MGRCWVSDRPSRRVTAGCIARSEREGWDRGGGGCYDRPMELKPLDGRKFPRFSGICTFFRLPHHPEVEDLDVAVLGVPWDGSVSFRPGARFGPRAVRDASVL